MTDAKKAGTEPEIRKIKLYIVEEQELLRDAYNAVLPSEPTIEVVGISGNNDTDSVLSVLTALQPDAVLLGTKMLQQNTITQLESIREGFPNLGIVLLSTLYDVKGIKQFGHRIFVYRDFA